LKNGTPLRPLIAANCAANAPAIVCRSEGWFFEKKGHRAFISLRLVALAKLNKSRVELASNPGTMPR
jgi:hypothetical protein